MIELVDGIPLVGLTAPTILGVVFLMVMTGRLIPRATFLDKVEEANRWREAYEKEREARALSDAQTAHLLELAKTTHDFIKAILNNSRAVRESGDPDASST